MHFVYLVAITVILILMVRQESGIYQTNVYYVQSFIYLKRFDTSRNVFMAGLM